MTFSDQHTIPFLILGRFQYVGFFFLLLLLLFICLFTSPGFLFLMPSFFFCRNKMVEYLTDWVMGTSNQAADDDIKCLTRWVSGAALRIFFDRGTVIKTE